MEEWKNINKEYEISNFGNVRRTKNGKMRYLKPEKLKKGYLRISIWVDGKKYRKLIHRLVAQYFLPLNNDESKTQIDHINCNPSDNRAENLRWVTPRENVQHSIELNRFVTEKKINAYEGKKLSDETKNKISESKKGCTPWNKGKKGLQKHTDNWKKQQSARMKERNKAIQTSIICIETGEIFESQAEASNSKKISQSNINSCLKGKRNVAGGFHWEYFSQKGENK